METLKQATRSFVIGARRPHGSAAITCRIGKPVATQKPVIARRCRAHDAAPNDLRGDAEALGSPRLRADRRGNDDLFFCKKSRVPRVCVFACNVMQVRGLPMAVPMVSWRSFWRQG